MLVLENVKRIDNIITANYRFVGGSEGVVTFDVLSSEIVSGVDRYECGVGHMKYIFQQMVEYDKYPAYIEIAWY